MSDADYNCLLNQTCTLVKEATSHSGEVTADTSFRADLNLDSLRMIELLSRCEEYFSVDLPLDRLASARTVGDIVEMLHTFLESETPK
jgi:acyl carrier protein